MSVRAARSGSRRRGRAPLKIHELSFAYGDRPPIFRGFSLDMRAGERVALVSDQADGKTTLAELIFGIRSADGGHIEVDGIDTRELSLITLRQRVAARRGHRGHPGNDRAERDAGPARGG